ncbi:Telomerase protein component 1 [Savitreella phatthalungensis]
MLASVLGRIASYPRLRYTSEGHDLDLSFVTPEICAMSLPSTSTIEMLYRNGLVKVRAFLDGHGVDWRVFELRAEGAGYTDQDFDGRVSHFPFVDHHPPPFVLLPQIVSAIDTHLSRDPDPVKGKPLAVVHCKAGKGRSGLATCSFLVARRGFTTADAKALFTEKRMRKGFGEGVSIPSQVRYLDYVSLWHADGERYRGDYGVRVTAVEVVGQVANTRLALRRFGGEGKTIETVLELDKSNCDITRRRGHRSKTGTDTSIDTSSTATSAAEKDPEGVITTYTLKQPLATPPDIGIYLSRGQAWMHCWFNAWFEDGLPTAPVDTARQSEKPKEGSFAIAWDGVDGWRGTTFVKGRKSFESVLVRWERPV